MRVSGHSRAKLTNARRRKGDSMPGEPPRSSGPMPILSHDQRAANVSSAPAQPSATLAAIESELERVRSEYDARSPSVEQALRDIRQRIAESRELAPPEFGPNYAL